MSYFRKFGFTGSGSAQSALGTWPPGVCLARDWAGRRSRSGRAGDLLHLLATGAVLLTLAPFAAARFLLRPLFRLFQPDPLKHYLKTPFSDCIGVWRFLALAISRRDEAVAWVWQFRRLRRFASDTERLFARIPLAERDSVFLPTVSAIELMGLAAYLGRTPVAAGASSHLLFRRDICRGPFAQNPMEEQSVEGLRRVFL